MAFSLAALGNLLAPVAMQFATILTEIAAFPAKFPALVTGGGVVAVAEVTAKFAAVMGDFCFIVANVAAQAAVFISGKCWGYARSYQQENHGNLRFHRFVLLPRLRFLVIMNTAGG